MGKSSIFSKEYEKKKRRKRRTIVISVLLIILAISCAIMYSTGNISFEKVKKMFSIKSDDKNNTKVTKPEIKKEEKKETPKDNSETNTKIEKQYIEIKLSSGTKGKAVYDGEGEGKKYVLVEPLQDGSTFDISKSAKNVLVNDATTQEIKLYDINGTEKNLTKLNYYTQSGQTFSKDSIIKQYPGYIWSKSAKFIDDDHIIYLSQLPWFKTADADVFAWIIDIKTGEHRTLWNVKGKKVNIGSLNDKGIAVDIDGNSKTVTVDGNIL